MYKAFPYPTDFYYKYITHFLLFAEERVKIH